MPTHCTIIFKPTHRCNLNCVYCYDRFERSKNKEIMSKEDAVYCLKKFQNHFERMTVIWHGGEPTVLGIDYLKYVMDELNATSKHPIDWSMQSNGTLLNDEWFQFIKDYNIHLGLSWDGINNKKTRGIELNLDYLREKRDQYTLSFGFLTTVTPGNAQDLILSSLYAELKGFQVDYNHLFGEGINKEGYSKIGEGLLSYFNFICQDINANVKRPFDSIINWLIGLPPHLCEHIYCPGFWFGLTPNGDVVPCGKPWETDLIFGNLLQGAEIEDLLNSPAMAVLKNCKTELLDHCRHCEYLLPCQNGCVYKNLRQTTTVFDEDYCYYMKILIKGCLEILKTNCENKTLVNKRIIAYLNRTVNGELLKWKNYKSPII